MNETNFSQDAIQSTQDSLALQEKSKHVQLMEYDHHKVGYSKSNTTTTKHSNNYDVLYIISILPMIFLTWIQFAFNLIVMAGVFYAVWKTVAILSSDIEIHIEQQSKVLFTEIIQCSREYVKNGCGQPNLPPAMEQICDKWKLCMEQDVTNIMKSTESAVVMGQILNKFFDSLSDRTIYSCATLFIGSILLINFMLSWAKIKSEKYKKKSRRNS
jgi:hypothetical protein